MLTGPPRTVHRARALRRTLSPPEVKLWCELRCRPGGIKVRRQQPAGHYVLDFYWAAARLAIEVDGGAHDYGDRQERDAVRDAALLGLGVRVLRVPVRDVMSDVDAVVRSIVAECGGRMDEGGPG